MGMIRLVAATSASLELPQVFISHSDDKVQVSVPDPQNRSAMATEIDPSLMQPTVDRESSLMTNGFATQVETQMSNSWYLTTES
jgi:hypothetical protein